MTAWTARERLDLALTDMASDGKRPRCADPADHELWVSDDHEDRARAAVLCAGCVVLNLCAAAADEEGDKWMARGGVDRRPNPQARATQTTKETRA